MPTANELPTPSTMTVGGKTYRVKPLSLGDLLELAKYHRDAAIAEVKRRMVGLPLELAKYVWDEGRKSADLIAVGSAEWTNANLTYEGLIYALWLSLRGEQPTVTPDDVRGMFDADLSLAVERASVAMGISNPDPTTPPPETTGAAETKP